MFMHFFESLSKQPQNPISVCETRLEATVNMGKLLCVYLIMDFFFSFLFRRCSACQSNQIIRKIGAFVKLRTYKLTDRKRKKRINKFFYCSLNYNFHETHFGLGFNSCQAKQPLKQRKPKKNGLKKEKQTRQNALSIDSPKKYAVTTRCAMTFFWCRFFVLSTTADHAVIHCFGAFVLWNKTEKKIFVWLNNRVRGCNQGRFSGCIFFCCVQCTRNIP